MKNRAYKDFKEIADLLYKIEKTVINSEKEEYPDYKKLCQTLIKHINDDIIELMMTYLDENEDDYARKLLYKTKRNLTALNCMVFDRIDPSNFDHETYLRFQQKIINWVDYYMNKIKDLMMNYYAICDHEEE
jgi:hypothetical protein